MMNGSSRRETAEYLTGKINEIRAKYPDLEIKDYIVTDSSLATRSTQLRAIFCALSIATIYSIILKLSVTQVLAVDFIALLGVLAIIAIYKLYAHFARRTRDKYLIGYSSRDLKKLRSVLDWAKDQEDAFLEKQRQLQPLLKKFHQLKSIIENEFNGTLHIYENAGPDGFYAQAAIDGLERSHYDISRDDYADLIIRLAHLRQQKKEVAKMEKRIAKLEKEASKKKS